MKQNELEVTKRLTLTNSNIKLPEGAAIVLPNPKEETTLGGLFLATPDIVPSDTGEVIHGPEEFKGKFLRFRASWGEEIEIDGVSVMYFSDIQNAHYYVYT